MTSFIKFLLVSLLFLTSALAVPLNRRDVVDPPVTTPNGTTVWTAGSTQTVVWDTSTLPPYNQITNKVGTVVLGFLDSNGENLMLDDPLAKGFNITQGSVQVVVPIVPTRSNYIIVLMGDSGNASPMFNIISDGPSVSLSGGSTFIVPSPSNPPPSTDGTTPTSSPSLTGETTTGSGSATVATPGTSSGGASTLSSSLPLTTSVIATSSAAVQATSTSSNGATSLHRVGATCFGAVFVLASLLL